MSSDRQNVDSKEEVTVPAPSARPGSARLRQAANRIDAAEDELVREEAEAEEASELAGYRLTGPLEDQDAR